MKGPSEQQLDLPTEVWTLILSKCLPHNSTKFLCTTAPVVSRRWRAVAASAHTHVAVALKSSSMARHFARWVAVYAHQLVQLSLSWECYGELELEDTDCIWSAITDSASLQLQQLEINIDVSELAAHSLLPEILLKANSLRHLGIKGLSTRTLRCLEVAAAHIPLHSLAFSAGAGLPGSIPSSSLAALSNSLTSLTLSHVKSCTAPALSSLSNLQVLGLHSVMFLETGPQHTMPLKEELAKLCSLTKLVATSLADQSLTAVYASLSALSSLCELSIETCTYDYFRHQPTHLASLIPPASLSKSLRVLVLNGNKYLTRTEGAADDLQQNGQAADEAPSNAEVIFRGLSAPSQLLHLEMMDGSFDMLTSVSSMSCLQQLTCLRLSKRKSSRPHYSRGSNTDQALPKLPLFFTCLKSLAHLEMDNCDLESLDGLSGLTALAHLSAADNPELCSYTALSALQRLTYINFSGSNRYHSGPLTPDPAALLLAMAALGHKEHLVGFNMFNCDRQYNNQPPFVECIYTSNAAIGSLTVQQLVPENACELDARGRELPGASDGVHVPIVSWPSARSLKLNINCLASGGVSRFKDSLASMQKLQHMVLQSDLYMDGMGFAGLAAFTWLQQLDLSKCSTLSAGTFVHMQGLKVLTSLVISGCRLSSLLVRQERRVQGITCHCPECQVFYEEVEEQPNPEACYCGCGSNLYRSFSDNNGYLPYLEDNKHAHTCRKQQEAAVAALGRLQQLKRLDMAGCNVMEAGGLAGLTGLTWLDAPGNCFDCAGIEAFGCMQQLQHAVVGFDGQAPTEPGSGAAFAALGKATSLTHLELTCEQELQFQYMFKSVLLPNSPNKNPQAFPCARFEVGFDFPATADVQQATSLRRQQEAMHTGIAASQLGFVKHLNKLQHLVLAVSAGKGSNTSSQLAATFAAASSRLQQLTIHSSSFLNAAGLAGLAAFATSQHESGSGSVPCVDAVDLTHLPQLVSPASLVHLAHLRSSLTCLVLSRNRLEHQSRSRAGVTRCDCNSRSRTMPLKALQQLVELQRLEMHDCGVHDAAILAHLTKLTHLGCTGNMFDLAGMQGLGKLSRLVHLDLQYGLARNAATAAAVCAAFGALSALTFLRASSATREKRPWLCTPGRQYKWASHNRLPGYLCQFTTWNHTNSGEAAGSGGVGLTARLCGPRFRRYRTLESFTAHGRNRQQQQQQWGMCCCGSELVEGSSSLRLDLPLLQHLLLPLDGACPHHGGPSLAASLQQLSSLSHLQFISGHRQHNMCVMALGSAAFAAQGVQQLVLEGRAELMQLEGCLALHSGVTALTCLTRSAVAVTVPEGTKSSERGVRSDHGQPMDWQQQQQQQQQEQQSEGHAGTGTGTAAAVAANAAAGAGAANGINSAVRGDVSSAPDPSDDCFGDSSEASTYVDDEAECGRFRGQQYYSPRCNMACVDTGSESGEDCNEAVGQVAAAAGAAKGAVRSGGTVNGGGNPNAADSTAAGYAGGLEGHDSDDSTAGNGEATSPVGYAAPAAVPALLFAGLQELSGLRVLDISRCYAKSLAGVSGLQLLTKLVAPVNSFIDKEVAAVVRQLPLLQHLDLHRALHSSGSEGADMLVSVLLVQATRLTYLDLCDYDMSGLGDEEWEAFVRSNGPAGGTGSRQQRSHLNERPASATGSAGEDGAREASVPAAAIVGAAAVVGQGEADQVPPAAAPVGLKVLLLCRCNVNDWKVRRFIAGSRSSSNTTTTSSSSGSGSVLQVLALSGNPITPAGLAALAPLCPRLTVLCASQLAAPTEEMAAAAAQVAWLGVHWNALQHCDLSGNYIGSGVDVCEGLMMMAKGMACLRHLNVSGNGLSPTDMGMLGKIAAGRGGRLTVCSGWQCRECAAAAAGGLLGQIGSARVQVLRSPMAVSLQQQMDAGKITEQSAAPSAAPVAAGGSAAAANAATATAADEDMHD